MPRTLTFSYGGAQFDCALNKIDRMRLYGSVDVETLDVDGNRCSLATLANDGKTLIPFGGTAFGYVNRDGHWVERSELVPVDLDGEQLPVLPSSFEQEIALAQRAQLEEFLDHSIRLCYALECESGFDPDMLKEMHEGAIFQFEFLYRDGVSPDPAFLLSDKGEQVWMMVGKKSKIDFTGLDQAAVCFAKPDADDEDEEEDAEFDFEML